MKQILLSVLFSSAVLHGETSLPEQFAWKVGYMPAVRSGYVFPGSSSEKASVTGLVAGKDFVSAGKSSQIQAWGFEGEWLWHLTSESGVFVAPRLVPFSLVVPGFAEQRGVDWSLSVGYEFALRTATLPRMGFRMLTRARRWEIGEGRFPDSGHWGLAIAAVAEGDAWSAEIEAGLAGFNLGNPESLGLQRDSSTLRIRGTYSLPISGWDFSPGLEFFHTHRAFYGSALIPGENSLFVDEVSLALILSTRW